MAIDCETRNKKRQKEFDEAPIATKEEEYRCEYLYSDEYPKDDGYFLKWEDFFELWAESHDDGDVRPEYVWITEPEEFCMDAGDVVDRYTEDLYEDAFYDILSEKIQELQKYLDEWCSESGVRTTYRESHKAKVRIPWEEY